MYTASTALLEALGEAGVSYIFANFGSDHPALIEAIAEARAERPPDPARSSPARTRWWRSPAPTATRR